MTEANIYLLYGISIPHVHQRLHDTPTKIETHANDCDYSRVRLRVLASFDLRVLEFDCEYPRLRVISSSIASTREFDYLSVRLRVLASILEFSARKFRLACGQCIARVRSLMLACARSCSRLALTCDIARDTSHSHTCMYTKKFLWRREKLCVVHSKCSRSG